MSGDEIFEMLDVINSTRLFTNLGLTYRGNINTDVKKMKKDGTYSFGFPIQIVKILI